MPDGFRMDRLPVTVTTMIETAALAHLMGAYFHQDWAAEFDSDWHAAADAFIAETPDLPPVIPSEWNGCSRRSRGMPASSHISTLGCEYSVLPGERGYRTRLTEIARRIQAATSEGV